MKDWLVDGNVITRDTANALVFFFGREELNEYHETYLTTWNERTWWLVPNNDNTFTVLSEL